MILTFEGMKDKMIHMNILIKEIDILKKRIKPSETGHIHTTIETLEHRVEELQNDMIDLACQCSEETKE